MPEVNPINVNTPQVTNQSIGERKAETHGEKAEKETAPKTETKGLSAQENLDVLDYQGQIAKMGIHLAPNALVNKYNTPEEIARQTEEMLNKFVPGAVAGLQKFEEEMGAAPAFQKLSEADKLALGAELYTSEAEW